MLTLLHGDALTQLKTLEDESVQTCVTSPPYWGLRDYGTATWNGGNDGCDHRKVVDSVSAVATSTLAGGKKTTGHLQEGFKEKCGRCGAERIDIQIGLEKTPEAYVAALVDVFREVKRVLRNDGTLWLNIGDTYAAQRGATSMPAETLAGGVSGRGDEIAKRGRGEKVCSHRDAASFGLKHKDLVGIPWMVAFALRADGWYLRSDIIWAKPNPMPESVTDRPTKSHEYIFLLAKSQKYYYDHDAIKEPASEFDWESRLERESGKSAPTKEINGIRLRTTDKQRGHPRRHAGFNDRWDAMERKQQCSGMRNKRSVWEIATHPFLGAHFATFPSKLIEPCILAGAPLGGVVLDPFAGSGTTGKVAIELGRKAILIEPKAEYIEMIERRCKTTIGLPLTA